MGLVVVDGRTDLEKLHELLALGGERDQVDFKATLDLSDPREELEFVKDAVSMLNTYPGGYIVVGCADDGTPSPLASETSWRQLDGAKLTDKLLRYVDAPVRAISQHLEDDGHEYCLICLQSLPGGLPIPFARTGQTGSDVVFHKGEVCRRHGPKNDVLRYAQWDEVLRPHDRLVRGAERMRINALIDRVTAALAEQGRGSSPLVHGMPEESLCVALQEAAERGERARLERFAARVASVLPRASALTELAGLGCHAALVGDEELFGLATDRLFDCYAACDRTPEEDADAKLRLLVAVYAMGSTAVRCSRWEMVAPLVLRNSVSDPRDVYASWLRECQVAASRADLFREEESGLVVSRTLEEVLGHPVLRPDVVADEPGSGEASVEDRVLDSLCRFDLLYCLCVYAAGRGSGGAYPACVAFRGARVDRVLAELLGRDGSARRRLLPGTDDATLAAALERLWDDMRCEAARRGHPWAADRAGWVAHFVASAREAHDGRGEAGTR